MVDTCAAEFDAATPYFYSTYETENEATPGGRRRGGRHRQRPDPHRAGDRVRLCERPRCLGAAGRRPPLYHGEFQPGNRLHRLRHQPTASTSNPSTKRACATSSRTSRATERRAATEHRPVRRPDGHQPRGPAPPRFAANHRFQRRDHRHGRGPAPLRTVPPGPRHPPAAGGGRDHARRGDEDGPDHRLPGARAPVIRPGRPRDGDRPERDRAGRLPGPGRGSQPRASLSLSTSSSKGSEVEVDAICDGETVLIPGIMEHIERAGVHSGDSMAVYPPRPPRRRREGDHPRLHRADRAWAGRHRPHEHPVRGPAATGRRRPPRLSSSR